MLIKRRFIKKIMNHPAKRLFAGSSLVLDILTGRSDILSSALSYTSGQHAAISVNEGPSSQEVEVAFKNASPGKRFYSATTNNCIKISLPLTSVIFSIIDK